MSTLLKKLADGRWVKADGSEDDVVRDGETIRKPLMMLDGKAKGDMLDASHQRPRYGHMGQNDADRVVDARAAYIARQQDAWRSPCPSQTPDRGLADSREPLYPPRPPIQLTQDKVSAAYDAYRRRLEDGYKHAKSSMPGRV